MWFQGLKPHCFLLFLTTLLNFYEPLNRRKPIIHLIQLKCRALSVVPASLRYLNAEGSLIR